MRALKLKLSPTDEQAIILNEMFRKWASVCNRFSLRRETKEDLSPDKINKQITLFNMTQLNQAEKDFGDSLRSMRKLGKQKKNELETLTERKSIIQKCIDDKNSREYNPSRKGSVRPKGWRKFHTIKYWTNELEKLNEQISRKEITIKKIDDGRICFKPKRIGLWSSSFKISFKDKKLLLRPFVDKEVCVNIITEPLQRDIGKKGGKSSLNSRLFLQKQIKDFLVYSLHRRLFGLNNSDKPLFKRNIHPIDIFYPINTHSKPNGNIGDAKKEFRDRIEKATKEVLSPHENTIIDSELERFWSKDAGERKRLYIEIKKEIIHNEDIFSDAYLQAIKAKRENINEIKIERLESLIGQLRFDTKIEEINGEIGKSLTENDLSLLEEEAANVLADPDTFLSHIYSEKYIDVLRKIADIQMRGKELMCMNKYPILFRKPTNKQKKLTNLKSTEWKYYIQFGYDVINKPHIDTVNIMGIDRGLTHLLAYSIFEPKTRKFVINALEPNPVSGWKWKTRKMKRSIQHLERRIRAQTNCHIHENQMKKRFRSSENKIEYLYHNVSRKIVNLAKEKNACIVFEDLEKHSLKQHGRKRSGRLKALNYALSLFDYGKIAALVKYKAELEGISVWRVDPAYTSQNCAKCVLESGHFVEPITILYVDDLRKGDKLNAKLLEGTGIIEATIDNIMSKKIELLAKGDGSNEIVLVAELKASRLIISKGRWESNENRKRQFIKEEDIAEFAIRKEIGSENRERIAILDYVYTRGKEKVGDRPKYTGNKKVGYCMKHGQIDADLNASRVIALCKYFKINEPKILK